MGIPIAARRGDRVRGVDAVRRHRGRADRAAVQRPLRHGHAVRAQGVRGRDPRRHHQRLGRDGRRTVFGVVEALVTATLGSGYTQIITFALVIAALALAAGRPLRPRARQARYDRTRRPCAFGMRGARRGSARSPAQVAACARGAARRRHAGQRLLRVRARQRRAAGDRRRRPQRADRPHGPGVVRPRRLLRDRRLRRRDPDDPGGLRLLARVAAGDAARRRRWAAASRSRRCG